MKVLCPHCNQVNESESLEIVDDFVKCATCEKWFEDPVPAILAADEIYDQARAFVGVSVFLLVLGLLIGAATFCDNLSADQPSHAGYTAAGVVISLAIWLYLIGQILHIRANTEK